MKLKHLLNENDKFKSEILKKFDSYDDFMEFAESVSVRDFKAQPKTTKELIEIMNTAIGKEGLDCDLNFIDTSKITDMSWLFYGPNLNFRLFEGDISKWDTSNVTDMSHMFERTERFNCPIGNWDTSKVTNMESMFKETLSFNQPLNKWDTSKVTNMDRMFQEAEAFKQSLDKWNVSNVETMKYMFSDCPAKTPKWYKEEK